MRLQLVPPRQAPAAATPVAQVDAVRDLATRFAEASLHTVPLVRGREFDRIADATGSTRVWFALEALQRTGSFKVRGALHAIGTRMARGEKSFVAASAGNHGGGLAFAGCVLGAPIRVVVPLGAPRTKCERMRSLGAEVIYGPTTHYDDAEEAALDLARREGHSFLSPYDDELVVAGNGASLALEIAAALGRAPDRVLAPFGGGGLATGLAWGFAASAGEPDLRAPRVYGVQSAVSPVMADSLAADRAIERFSPEAPSLAEGLTGGISAAAYARARDAIQGVLVVSETAIALAMAHAYRELGLVIEGSAAVSLVPILAGLPEEVRGGDLVAVITGRNVDNARWEMAIHSEAALALRSIRPTSS